eukprot:c7574_g1_i2.p1 GENE.c7574_g1_i2~~c7574_g1_i2.p1  ORF type:complete len:216 (-),score=48.46 c7574_g1_i2:149-796(-)
MSHVSCFSFHFSAMFRVFVCILIESRIGDDGARDLAIAIESGNCRLTALDLGFNHIGDEGTCYIAKAIKSGKCELTHLDMYGNQIGDLGAFHMATAIESDYCLLTWLMLNENGIGDEGAFHIANAVDRGKCHFKVLSLNRNPILSCVLHLISRALFQHVSFRVLLIEYIISRQSSSDELKVLLALSSNFNWADVVEVILSRILELHGDKDSKSTN